MAHVFVAMEARQVWMDAFLHDLNMRRYQYTCVDGNTRMVQPNMREIRFFDCSLPEECIPLFLSDLAPFAVNDPSALHSDLKGIVGKIKNMIIKFVGLKPLNLDGIKASGQCRHAWVNIIPFGWKEDNKDAITDMGYFPKGGELV